MRSLSPGFQAWQSQACLRRTFDGTTIHFGFKGLGGMFLPPPQSRIRGTSPITAKPAKAEKNRVVAWFATNKHWGGR